MFNKLTSRARDACNHAGSEAIALKATVIGAEHLLLGLLVSDQDPPFEASLEQLRQAAKQLPIPQESGPTLSYSQEAMDILRTASKLATDGVVDVSHLWRALLQDSTGSACIILEKADVDIFSAQQSVNEMLRSVPNSESPVEISGVDALLTNLCDLALANKLAPLVGREPEIQELMTSLARWGKNAPVLVGEPGVGKTAIVEGLAQKLAQGQAPKPLRGCEIVSLNLGALLAGTRYRGDLENRVQELFKMVNSNANLILFIDEIHTVLGAGNSEGAMDLAGLIKPLLARGDFRMIGATTSEEYSRKLERDPAFARRLQKITVTEPTLGESIEILQGLKETIQAHHKVQIDSLAIKSAVELSCKYMTTQHLPDKAVDVVDQAAALASLAGKTKVTQKEIAQVVSAWTGVPQDELQQLQDSNMLDLENKLSQQVIGQEHAVQTVSLALLRQSAGLGADERPVGSFLFCGPTGVGKTELARTLAKEVFLDANALTRFDMSEYAERHDASRLIGAPPGYTGHQDGGQLVNAIRDRSACVLLFDEIEKAHPDIVQLLLQILEEGELRDGRGRIASFRNAIIILTSNLGAKWSNHSRPHLGFGGGDLKQERTAKMEEEVGGFFTPELIGRLDEIVIFQPLQKEHLTQITEIHLRRLKDRLLHQGIKLSWNKSAVSHMTANYLELQGGARGVRNMIRKHVEDQIAPIIVAQQPSKIKVTLKSDQLAFVVN